MARVKKTSGTKPIKLDLGHLNEKQKICYNALMSGKYKYVFYGGAKYGGKTHLDIRVAVSCALQFNGIRILVIRQSFADVLHNHIEPTLALLPNSLYSYNGKDYQIKFINGSIIQYGNWENEKTKNKYQGQQYDILIIDESTQFSYQMFTEIAAVVRGNEGKGFPKFTLLTANPGGVGHVWHKRLFVDRDFRIVYDEDGNIDLKRSENPDNYYFVQARVEDNVDALKDNPDYDAVILKMPNGEMLRYGSWDVNVGQYFDNFSKPTHTVKAFGIPSHWQIYRSFDYGYDLFACFWYAVDEDGRAWVFRAYEKSDLNPSDAAKAIVERSKANESVQITFAPPDLWGRLKETGKSTAKIFSEYGVDLVKANNNRIQGHWELKSMLNPIPLTDPYVRKMLKIDKDVDATLPAIMFFDNIDSRVFDDLDSIQHDEKNSDDCAKEPHDVTHTIDALRYFCMFMADKSVAPAIPKEKVLDDFFDDYNETEVDRFLGGDVTEEFLNYGATFYG